MIIIISKASTLFTTNNLMGGTVQCFLTFMKENLFQDEYRILLMVTNSPNYFANFVLNIFKP